MEILSFDKKSDEKIYLALGFFDCVHLGHRYLMSRTVEDARACGQKSAVFTFSNNPFTLFGGAGQICTFEERCEIFAELGADYVIAAHMDEAFSRLSPQSFLSELFSRFGISALYCGPDYTFGYKGSGNVDMLKSLASQNVVVNVCDFLLCDGSKISSSTIRGYLQSGDVRSAAKLAGKPYSVSGTVRHDYGRGGRIVGFPTANISPSPDKLLPEDGVYLTTVEIDGSGTEHLSITNVGGKPTFGESRVNVESYIQNFSGDLYGKKIRVRFYDYLRPVQKFADAAALGRQLEADCLKSLQARRKI